MSRLDELIAEYCPNGVEYRSFSETCEYIRGVTYNKGQEAKNGDPDPWKILRANNITLSHNVVNFEDVKLIKKEVRIKPAQFLKAGDILICAGSGSKEHVGKVAYISENTDYSFGGFMAAIRCAQILNSRYFFHILTGTAFKTYLSFALNSTTINNLNSSVMAGFTFPVPPLPVQREIVRILDNFTELTAELTAELNARKKQYEYYRNELLNNLNDNVPTAKIKDVFRRIKGTPITAGMMKEIEDPNGEIRIFAGGKTAINAKEESIPNANITHVPAVLVQSRGVIDAVYYDKPFTFKNEMWAYTNENIVSVKYLYYVLKNNIQYFRTAASGMGSLPQISLPVTEEYLIKFPTISEQEWIVNILDRFDTLCSDIYLGLPAEIEARQKQYEHYRDKLLTFKEKIA